MTLRRWLVPVLLALAVMVPLQAPLHGQDLGPLKDASSKILEGCDKTKYLKLGLKALEADNLGEVFGHLRESGFSWDFKSVTSLPMTDYLSFLTHIGQTKAARETSKTSHKNLLTTIESLCNTISTADEVNRMYGIVKDGQLNIGNALDALEGEMDYSVDLSSGEPSLNVEFADKYDNLFGGEESGTVRDSMDRAISDAAKGAIATADTMQKDVDELEAELEKIERKLVEVAQPDTAEDSHWRCPNGYPDPDTVNLKTDPVTGRPVCGIATPERSEQITAQLEALQAKIAAMRQGQAARKLEIQAVHLLEKGFARKKQAFINNLQVSKLEF